ncbi:MAG: hypothetical protein ACKVQT_05905 [Burkholderiales bacterium]
MTDMSGPIKWNRTLVRFRFHIRTVHGLQVERLVIHGRDQADAERKLRQMYHRCEVIACTELPSSQRLPGGGLPQRPLRG